MSKDKHERVAKTNCDICEEKLDPNAPACTNAACPRSHCTSVMREINRVLALLDAKIAGSGLAVEAIVLQALWYEAFIREARRLQKAGDPKLGRCDRFLFCEMDVIVHPGNPSIAISLALGVREDRKIK